MDTVVDSIDDASITALVKATLLNHRSTSAINTTVETKDGVVTLGGKAKTAAEKDLAGKFAGDVHGCKQDRQQHDDHLSQDYAVSKTLTFRRLNHVNRHNFTHHSHTGISRDDPHLAA